MKTSTKILLLITLIIMAFGGLFLHYRQLEDTWEKDITGDMQYEQRVVLDKIIQLKRTPLENHVYFEYSLWDEMVDFVKTKNKKWADNQSESAMDTYNIEVVWIYDTAFNKIYTLNKLDDQELQEIPLPENVLPKLFSKGYFCHFFVKTNQGLMEILGSSIHPTVDTDRQTPIRGYYFIGHIWSNDFMEELNKITDCQIQFDSQEKDKPLSIKNSSIIHFTKELYGWDGQPASKLYIQKESLLLDQFHHSSRRVTILFVSFAIGLILILFYFLTRWIGRPLSTVSESLIQQNPNLISHLEKDRSEFGHIAELIKQFFQQKSELVREISDRKSAEEKLIQTNSALQAIFDTFPDLYLLLDKEGIILDYRVGKLSDLFVPSEEFLHNNISKVFPPEVGKLFEQAVQMVVENRKTEKVEYWLNMPNGEQAYEARLLPSYENQIIAIIRDITDRKRMEEALRSLSLTDELTNLFNRRGFTSLAEQTLKTSGRMKLWLVVLFIDLDRMKQINDTHGHAVGDQALILLAKTLKSTFRQSDIVARIGGDEFVVLAMTKSEKDWSIMMERFHQKVELINQSNLLPFQISVSSGYSQSDPEKPSTLEELMDLADKSMYMEKNKKRLN